MMKLKRILKKGSAALLSVLLTVAMLPAAAYADGNTEIREDGTIVVRANEEVGDADESIGDVTVDSEDYSALAVGAGEEHTAVVTAGELTNTNITGTEHNNGLSVWALDNGSANVSVEGNIDGGFDGLYVDSDNGNADITVNGDVTGNNFDGLRSFASEGKSTVTIVGDTTGGQGGAAAAAYKGGENDLFLIGDATGLDDDSGGVYAYTEDDGLNQIFVNGNVTGVKYGVYAEAQDPDGRNNIIITGNVTGDNWGIVAYNDGGTNVALVGGDVSSTVDGAGLMLGSKGGENYVLIEGTLSGGEIGVQTTLESDSNPVKLTVWKVEPNADGMVAGKWDNENKKYIEDREVEKSIQYIIKVAQPEAGATIKATAADGGELNVEYGLNYNQWQWAHEGDTVLLKVDVEDGYEVTGAYGDEGQTVRLLKDANGDYYIEVPKGGGVYLSVEVSKVSQKKDSDDDSESGRPEWTSPSYSQTSLSDTAVIPLIEGTPAGGTASLTGLTGTGLNASLVQSLLARRDISVSLTFILNGVVYRIVIPAGADLTSLINASGGIDFTSLISAFGSAQAD